MPRHSVRSTQPVPTTLGAVFSTVATIAVVALLIYLPALGLTDLFIPSGR